MSPCNRLIPGRPFGKAALNDLISNFELGAGADSDLASMLAWLQDLLSQMVTAIPPVEFEEEDGSMHFPITRRCPPEIGQLSSTGGLESAASEKMSVAVCYCNDDEADTTNTFLSFHLATATEIPAVPPDTHPTWLTQHKVALVPLLDWPPECCQIPCYTWWDTEGAFGTGTRTFVAPIGDYSASSGSATNKTEWTAGSDVWGTAPTLATNLNNLGTLIRALETAYRSLAALVATFIQDLGTCTGWGEGLCFYEGPG